MLGNLLTNAVKYSPDSGTIRAHARREGDHVLLEISDEGIGIPVEDQAHLFEAFHRASNVGETSGTGLGLLLVKRCVEIHLGTIAFESTVGRGTTFRVTLPIDAA
jgi:signal transduction histidine kinase